MHISSHLALVGSGQFGLSSRYDCHVWLLIGPEGGVVVDSGSGLATDEIVYNLRTDFPGIPVRALLVTHAHTDHFGGAAELSSRLSTPVIVPAPSHTIIETGDEQQSGLRDAQKAGVYPPHLRLVPCAVASTFSHDDVLNLAGLAFRVNRGHSADSCCFAVQLSGAVALFSADVVFNGGVLGVINTPDSGMQGYQSDLPRLANLGVDALLHLMGYSLYVTGRSTSISPLSSAPVPFSRDKLVRWTSYSDVAPVVALPEKSHAWRRQYASCR